MCIDIITGILGTGFMGSALLNYYVIRENRRLNKENRIFSNLQTQLHNLYAPLNFLVLENENTFNLYDKYHKEYSARYENKKWSQDKKTQEAIDKESKDLLEVANRLINENVIKNNEKIITLLRDNSGHIDSDDNNIFNKFIEHYKRLKTEFNKSGKLIIPLRIYENIGDVSYMLPEFAQRIKEKYNQKRKNLESLISKSDKKND